MSAFLRVDSEDDIDLVNDLIITATNYLDGWDGALGLCLIQQSWRQDFDVFDYNLRLPLAPVASITSVTYLDASDATQTVNASKYTLLSDDEGYFVRFNVNFTLPTTSVLTLPAVSITYVAGFGTKASDVPQPIKQAMRMLVAHWYKNRETVGFGGSDVDILFGTQALLDPYRRVGF